MKMHLAAAPDTEIDPVEFERRTMEELGCPKEIVMRHRPTAFAHIFSSDGYSAGYYAYIWADTMSADAAEAFSEAGSFYDRETCRRFRDTIFSRRAIPCLPMQLSATSAGAMWTPTPSCANAVSQLVNMPAAGCFPLYTPAGSSQPSTHAGGGRPRAYARTSPHS